MGNMAIYKAVEEGVPTCLVITVLFVAAVRIRGEWRMGHEYPIEKTVRAAVAQANIPQDRKWPPKR